MYRSVLVRSGTHPSAFGSGARSFWLHNPVCWCPWNSASNSGNHLYHAGRIATTKKNWKLIIIFCIENVESFSCFPYKTLLDCSSLVENFPTGVLFFFFFRDGRRGSGGAETRRGARSSGERRLSGRRGNGKVVASPPPTPSRSGTRRRCLAALIIIDNMHFLGRAPSAVPRQRKGWNTSSTLPPPLLLLL